MPLAGCVKCFPRHATAGARLGAWMRGPHTGASGPRQQCLTTRPPTAGPALGCLTGHADYVTGVAASSASGTLASGGLRGEVLLWDLEALRNVMTGAAPDSSFGATPADGPRGSIYAIGMNAAGSLVATGSTEVSAGCCPLECAAAAAGGAGWMLAVADPLHLCRCGWCRRACAWLARAGKMPARPTLILTAHPAQALVSLIDVRGGQAVMQLKGHSDNIRRAGACRAYCSSTRPLLAVRCAANRAT